MSQCQHMHNIMVGATPESLQIMIKCVQGVAVMPCNMKLPQEEASMPIQCLRLLNISPDTLLLPWKPDCAYSRVCAKESLLGLLEVLLEESGSLSKWGQVRVRHPLSRQRTQTDKGRTLQDGTRGTCACGASCCSACWQPLPIETSPRKVLMNSLHRG